MTAKGHCKILFDENPNAAWEYVDFYDYSFVSTLTIKIDENFVNFFSSTHPDQTNENLDDDLEENFLDTTGYELVLPSGKKVGHRTLIHYYRQSLNQRNNDRSVELVNKIKDKYRALGWSGYGTTGSFFSIRFSIRKSFLRTFLGEAFQRKIRDLRYMQQWKSKQHMRLGVRNNMHQHHFRQQVNF